MNKDELLDQAIAGLSKEIEPNRPLWSGIEKAMEQEKSPSYRFAMPVAAAVLMAVLVGWLGMQSAPVEQQNDNWLTAISAEHQQQKDELLVKYEGQQALADNWQTQMKDLEKAEVAIKAALVDDPNNMAMVKMLQSIYQQQINLIERVYGSKWQNI